MSNLEDKVEKARALAEATVAALSEPTEQEAADKIVAITILVTPEDRKRLRQLALNEDTSIQKLGHAAWNKLLFERALDPLTPVTANVPSGMRR